MTIMTFQVARHRTRLVVALSREDAALLRGLDWDACHVAPTLLLSPGRRRSSDGRRIASHVDRYHHHGTYEFCIPFTVVDMPYFGAVELEGRVHDDDSITIEIPPLHTLPWPVSCRQWSQEELRELVLQRAEAATLADLPLRIPSTVRPHLRVETWSQLRTALAA